MIASDFYHRFADGSDHLFDILEGVVVAARKKERNPMLNPEYLKKVIATLVGAAVAIPTIAACFYVTYQVVTSLGN